MNREFLQLAHTYNPDKHGIGGWYVSEKLDGMRAYWDGGISRGQLCSQIKYANTSKDYRRVTPPRATGLWSRYAKPIAAPDWFLDGLPTNIPLDGELYMGRGMFQDLISCVKRAYPGESWHDVYYHIFDVPSDYEMFSPGKINNPNCKLELDDLRDELSRDRPGPLKFRQIEAALENRQVSLGTGHLVLARQIQLPMQTEAALVMMETFMGQVTDVGGEGLILRNPNSIWVPKRTYDLLKVKPWSDSEAIVDTYVWGKGKLEGLMGALKVRWRGKSFELSGFTDKERELIHKMGSDKAYGEPGTEVPVGSDVTSVNFPKGSKVTFKYRELTRDGIPKEARFWRKKEESA